MKFKLRLLLSLLPFADPFADDGEAPFRQNLRSEINRILFFFSFFFSPPLKFLERRERTNDEPARPFPHLEWWNIEERKKSRYEE